MGRKRRDRAGRTRPACLCLCLRQFLRDHSGATAVEFGLLALPFFAIVGAILETSLLFFSGQVLDSAVRDASRQILTGQARTFDAARFKTLVCNNLYAMLDCDQLRIHVTTLDTFSGATTEYPLDPTTGEFVASWQADQFSPGSNNSVVMVQAYYKAPVLINLGYGSLQNTADGKRLLGAVRVFRNEP